MFRNGILPLVTYTHGNDLSASLQEAGGIGGLLARSEMSNLQSPHAYYHADGNGNITALVNTNGLLVARYHYDPYGNTLAAVGPLAEANLYRFSSKEFHPNSGLVYYLYRYYEPALQRWINQDPIEEDGGINLYGFVGNDPANHIDPDGELLHAIAGGLLSVGIGAAIAWVSGDCYNIKDALIDFGTGVIGTGLAGKLSKVVKPRWSRANRAFPRGIERAEESHLIPRRFSDPKSKDYKGLPKWVTENPLNKTRIPGETHARIDPSRHRFLKQPMKESIEPYDPARRWWYRTPPWMKGGAAGGVATPTDGDGTDRCNFWSWN